MTRSPARTRAAAVVGLGGGRLELDEFDVPELEPSWGLLRVEACGVCGSDVKKYKRDIPPTILGHETVGRIERAGSLANMLWGLHEGDRVMLEEYLPCGHCGFCRSGEYRSCVVTDISVAGALRYGSTPTAVPPALWGGYSQFQVLHPLSILHRVPDGLSPHHATFALPLSNGIQWTQADGGVRAGDVVVIQGPGQQGLGCVIAAVAAGAGHVVVSGLEGDGKRLALARELGADVTVDVSRNDLVDTVLDLTGGRGADVSIDVTGTGATALDVATTVTRKRGRVVIAAGSGQSRAEIDLGRVRRKQLTVIGVRGHSFDAVERALATLAASDLPMDRLCGEPYPLEEVAAALEATAGLVPRDAVHASVDAWR